MATGTCCSESKKEQLYMLELLVDRLNLTPEKIQQIGSTPLSVRLEFLDFPTFEINEEEFWSAKKRRDKQTSLLTERRSRDGSLDFSAGKSCLFPKKPSELVEAMRSKPLVVGVYKVTEKQQCKPELKDDPVCKSEVPLSGCLCDQVAMAMNDPRHLPKPYTVRNTWNLVDEQGTPSGTILLFLKLSCLGKSIVTQFAVQEKSFLFKSSNSPNEFQCSRVPADEEDVARRAKEPTDGTCAPEGYGEPEVNDSPKPRSIIGLASVCQELSKRDGGALEIVPPIKFSTNRSIEEKCLQRSDVVKANFPNLQCVIQPSGTFVNGITNDFPCGSSNCGGGLCTGTRVINPLPRVHHGGSAASAFHTGSCCSGNRPNYRYRPRMRGGGRWGENAPDIPREYRDPAIDRVPIQSAETLISGACKSPVKDVTDTLKPGCGCFGKLGTGMMGIKSATATRSGAAGCSNNPCLGVDCLIRAFKETQDFVDSIGKVPGLAGLGLMDPAESPFFGRERDEAPTSCVAQIGASATPLGLKASSVHPLAARNAQTAKRWETRAFSTIPPAPTIGHVTPAHRDPNIHQPETQVSGRLKKKPDERAEKQKEFQEPSRQATAEPETGPCAEPRCKSRKKKPREESVNDASTTNLQVAPKKIALGNKLQASSRVARTRTRGKSKASTVPGPGGDRPSGQRSSYIRVSKRIMRLVNAMRDPRFSHGHKNCHDVRIRVPGNMGWLWNSSEVPGKLKTPIGWKPGAISKFVWDRLQEAKAMTAETGSTSDSRPTTPSKGKRGKSSRIKSLHSLGRSQWARSRMLEKDDDEVELPPTLHVHRKDGTYYVTMYPVKSENVNNPELHEAVKPMQFKITKNKDDVSACSSSTASDMEIEFSPPAAVNRYTKKVPVENRDTQVSEQEILDALKVNVAKRQSKSKKAKFKK